MAVLSPAVMLGIFLGMVAGFALGAILAPIAATSPRAGHFLAHGMALLGSTGAIILGFAGMTGAPLRLQLSTVLPFGGLDLALWPLSSLFLLTIGLVAMPVSIYALSVPQSNERQPAQVAWIGCCSNLLLLSMVLAPLARNAQSFLLIWGGLTISAYCLIVTRSATQAAVQAGRMFAIAGYSGMSCLLVGFLLLSRWSGSLDFATFHNAAQVLEEPSRSLAFALFSLGFTIQIGALLLALWITAPQAGVPDHVAALLATTISGPGMYGMLLIGFDLLAPAPTWWGVSLLIIGGVAGVLGALFISLNADLQRTLTGAATSNIGITLIGLGMGLLFVGAGRIEGTYLALVAALAHLVHQTFVLALLLLGTGAVAYTTSTRAINRLGGLIRPMPWTATLFLIGTLALAGLPPLSSFTSLWLTFQALLAGAQPATQLPASLRLVCILSAALLALSVGLAAAGAVRAFGGSFLGLPRSDAAVRAQEATRGMRAAMGLLGLICIGLGLFPALSLPFLSKALAGLLPASDKTALTYPALAIQLSAQEGVAPLWLAGALAFTLLATLIVMRLAQTQPRTRTTTTGLYAETGDDGRAVYTPAAFATPFRWLLATLYQPRGRRESGWRLLIRIQQRLARRFPVVQPSNVQIALAGMLITLLTLLAFVRWW